MSTRVFSRLFLFLALVFVQTLILCQVRLFGYCMPLLLVYYLVLTPSHQPRVISVLEGFLLGLCMDMSLNTPGMGAAAMTLTAFVNPYILGLTAEPDKLEDDFVPSSLIMGWGSFMLYGGMLTTVFAVAYFLIEWFSFAHVQGLLLNIFGSLLLTLPLFAAVELIHRKMATTKS
ncbi:MAG: rod shape-determining protein MreD [Bacteroidaceae bacterium]|nr:rod shape-determining protein MreD [Bacteroidaceae bacterium]